MREPGDVLAMPVVIADLAVLARVFLAECALNLLEILHCLVTLSFCSSLGCDGGVTLLYRNASRLRDWALRGRGRRTGGVFDLESTLGRRLGVKRDLELTLKSAKNLRCAESST